MSHGYSHRTVLAVLRADSVSLGVALGRLCIELDIPVSAVADALGVSRMAVYKWFDGTSVPSPKHAPRIQALMQSYKKRPKKK